MITITIMEGESIVTPEQMSSPENEQSVEKLLEEKQTEFQQGLNDIKHELVRDYSRQMAEQGNQYRPLPELNMCGFSAAALTDGLRKRYGEPVNAKTVYGHYENNDDVEYHYWTEFTDPKSGEEKFACGTYEQFDDNYEGKILVQPKSELANFHLKPYEGGGTAQEDLTVQVIQEKGNLPIEQDYIPSISEKYRKLVNSIAQ